MERKLIFSNFFFSSKNIIILIPNFPLQPLKIWDKKKRRKIEFFLFLCRLAHENSIVSTICGRNLKFCWRSSRDWRRVYPLRVSAHWSVVLVVGGRAPQGFHSRDTHPTSKITQCILLYTSFLSNWKGFISLLLRSDVDLHSLSFTWLLSSLPFASL